MQKLDAIDFYWLDGIWCLYVCGVMQKQDERVIDSPGF